MRPPVRVRPLLGPDAGVPRLPQTCADVGARTHGVRYRTQLRLMSSAANGEVDATASRDLVSSRRRSEGNNCERVCGGCFVDVDLVLDGVLLSVCTLHTQCRTMIHVHVE